MNGQALVDSLCVGERGLPRVQSEALGPGHNGLEAASALSPPQRLQQIRSPCAIEAL